MSITNFPIAAGADDYQSGHGASSSSNTMVAQDNEAVVPEEESIANAKITPSGLTDQRITGVTFHWYNHLSAKSRGTTWYYVLQMVHPVYGYTQLMLHESTKRGDGWDSYTFTAEQVQLYFLRGDENWLRFLVGEVGGTSNFRTWSIRTWEYDAMLHTFASYLEVTHEDAHSSARVIVL